MPTLGSSVLLEVMDKEPSLATIWIAAIATGVVGHLLAHRRRWLAVPVLVVAALGVLAVWSEWSDPSVGPAIAAEAGRSYGFHVIAAGFVAATLTLAGLIRRRQQPNEEL